MGIFIVWILFSVLIGLIGKGKKIGFGLSFLVISVRPCQAFRSNGATLKDAAKY